VSPPAARTTGPTTGRRWPALGGVVGPVAFIAAWALLGAGREGYSPVTDPISRLAAVGEPTRAAMTGAMVALGAGLALHATALHAATRDRPGRSAPAVSAAISAAGALGVAALPLGAAVGDGAHAGAVAVAYTSLAATPLLAARALPAGGRRARLVSVAAGLACGAALLASVAPLPATGLFQRLGLTTAHAWFIASGLWLAGGGGLSRPPTARR
jgi:hypothetical protein